MLEGPHTASGTSRAKALAPGGPGTRATSGASVGHDVGWPAVDQFDRGTTAASDGARRSAATLLGEPAFGLFGREAWRHA
jgi:hypothetical protein